MLHNGHISQTKVTHQNSYDYSPSVAESPVAACLANIPDPRGLQPPPGPPHGPHPALPPPPGPAGPVLPAVADKASRAKSAAPAPAAEASPATKERERFIRGLQEFRRRQRELMAEEEARARPPRADAGPPLFEKRIHRKGDAERER